MENKFILILSLILAIAMIMVPASAANDNKDLTQGQPFLDVWEALTSGLSDLQDNIDAEEAARIAADDTLQDNIDAEEAARIAADDTLQDNIDAEEAARIAADDTLQDNIDAEEAARIAADDTLQDNIDAEEAARIAADDTLQDNIDAEEAARIAADDTLQDNIDAEEAARIAADDTLQDNIDAEEAARIAADDTLQDNIDGMDDGRSVKVFTGTLLNPGDTATHTLYTQSNHDSSYLELLVLVHDGNSNTNRLYHHGEYAWYREWTNPPTKQVLGTPIDTSTGRYKVDTIASGNDIQVKVEQLASFPGSTNGHYTIIAKWIP
ncbi:hypothetical protein [Methanococcoides seepicolus]|uniref:Uncharacterized protein n=1 Tax=Methanococcoides seepicolus TaxID=2828780 RepID=A0A9E4ZFR7_9EURY|nr:hypothetical protein [Methanococcoides seepicolus]MCM1986104.1 hypothetical protein [Methanococcoides seepicolus]